MIQLDHRSYKLELLDLGPAYYTLQEYTHCLYQLNRIGRFLGGDKATLSAFRQLHPSPLSILDVGCGGGGFAMHLAQQFSHAHILGIDTNPHAIAYAQDQLKNAKSTFKNLSFEVSSTPELNYPPHHFDVITSTLVCHHLTDEALIDFLRRSYKIAKQAIIINDLHRHLGAYFGFKFIAPLLFSNRLILHDGPLSVQRSFKKQDWINYLQAAKIPLTRCRISWHWAFRWILYIDTSHGYSHDS